MIIYTKDKGVRQEVDKPKQKAKTKELMKYCLDYLSDDEIDAGRPKVSEQDDLMDIRSCWVALRDGDYDYAVELAECFDSDLKENIKKLLRMRS
jgi:hypothetical protein